MAYQVVINGIADTKTSNAVLVLYFNGVVYYQNSSNIWFQQTTVNWNQIAQDPRLVATTNLITLPGGADIFMPDGSVLSYPGGAGTGPLPAQVTQVTGSTSANLLTINWAQVTGVNITYTVFTSNTVNGSFTQAISGVTTLTASIIATHGATYYAEVQAVNVNGAGPLSAVAGPFVVP